MERPAKGGERAKGRHGESLCLHCPMCSVRYVLFARLLTTAVVIFGALGLSLEPAPAAEYYVGPGRTCAAIGDVPWESLNPGDTVLIYWRSGPYNEKWVICRRGTESNPITVKGVPGPSGELPVIDGRNATTRAPLNYWNEGRSLIKIGGANIPPDTTPAYVIVAQL
jgi:hypothetical protein